MIFWTLFDHPDHCAKLAPADKSEYYYIILQARQQGTKLKSKKYLRKNKNKLAILLQKLSEHLEPIVIFARVLLKSLFEPLFISQLHKCSSCFAWKGHTLTRPNRSQELGPADIILTWVGQINYLDI